MYSSPYTVFTAHDKPLTNVIYYKFENETLITIYIEDDWTMYGTVQHPEYLGIGFQKLNINQKECEQLLLKNAPPPCRIKTLKNMGLDKYDSAEIIYRTRGINLLDKTWFAWSQDDKIEDYHPLCNKRLMKERNIPDLTEEEDKYDNEPYDKIPMDFCEELRLKEFNYEGIQFTADKD